MRERRSRRRPFTEEQLFDLLARAFDEVVRVRQSRPSWVPFEHVDHDEELRAACDLGALTILDAINKELQVGRRKLRSTSTGGRETADRARGAAKDELTQWQQFRAKHPQLSDAACSRLFEPAGRKKNGEALLRRLRRQKARSRT